MRPITQGDGGWVIAEVLDYPGVLSQGRTLKSARRMIRDALRLMAECDIEEGRTLPSPNGLAKQRRPFIQKPSLFTFGSRPGARRETAEAVAPPRSARLLRAAGGEATYGYPQPGYNRQSEVPRHREIDTALARGICRQLHIPPPPER